MNSEPIPKRLVNHSLVVVVFFVAGAFAPGVLFLGRFDDNNLFLLGLGLLMLATGAAALIGGAITRCIDLSAASALQRRLLLLVAWVFNPVFVVIVGLQFQIALAWYSGVPLAIAITLLSGRLRLVEGDQDWSQEGCPPRPSTCIHWCFSRLVVVGLPMAMLSFQAALYLPQAWMLPQGTEVGLFVCGGCVLISAKFCAMCACLARQRPGQAFVLVVLLSADWISSLHLMEIIGDDTKVTLLLSHLAAAGVMQTHIALQRLALRPRWARALQRRRAGARDAASVGVEGAAVELGVHINAGAAATGSTVRSLESSDSDDERGPGSLPEGFHETLLAVTGVPAPGQGAQRQFLLGLRSAVVGCGLCGVSVAQGQETESTPASNQVESTSPMPESMEPAITVATNADLEASSAVAAASLTSYPPLPSDRGRPLLVAECDRICTVCQDDILTGDIVRPLPKCSHVFHASCLEGWAKTMREETRCPTCRRPALARRCVEGCLSIQTLTACGDGSTTSSSSGGARGGGRGGRGRAGGAGRRQAVQRPARQPRPGRGPATAQLRGTLGVSEAMAHAALDCSRGAPDVAAHIILEHRGLLEVAFASPAGGVEARVPPGVHEAFIEGNPDLASVEVQLRRHLSSLYQSGRLSATNVTSWASLSQAQRVDTYRLALEDVVRRLEERATNGTS